MEDQINGHDANADEAARRQESEAAGRAAQVQIANFIGNVRLNAFRATVDLPQGHEHNALCAMAFVLGELTQLVFKENAEVLGNTLNVEFQRGVNAVLDMSDDNRAELLETYQKAVEIQRGQEAQAAHGRILRPGDPGYGMGGQLRKALAKKSRH